MIAVGGSRFRRGGIECVRLFIRGPQDALGNRWTKLPAQIKDQRVSPRLVLSLLLAPS